MTVTETIYRKQLRPIIDDGAIAMNRIFPASAAQRAETDAALRLAGHGTADGEGEQRDPSR